MQIYEIQWELNARLGGASQTPAELERRLQQSRLFARDTQGRYDLVSRLAEQVADASTLRRACSELLTARNEVAGCDDMLERLVEHGMDVKQLSVSLLAAILRGDETFEEVGTNRFRVAR